MALLEFVLEAVCVAETDVYSSSICGEGLREKQERTEA
jgi:hypothetical protein